MTLSDSSIAAKRIGRVFKKLAITSAKAGEKFPTTQMENP